jgi:hypothetical protein
MTIDHWKNSWRPASWVPAEEQRSSTESKVESVTVFHNGEPLGVYSEHQNCIDCGYNVWKKAGMEPYGGCLCIGCLEKRLGRKLKPKDFQSGHPFKDLRGTPRLIERRGG